MAVKPYNINAPLLIRVTSQTLLKGGEAHQSTVDGDALFGSITRRSGSLQPL